MSGIDTGITAHIDTINPYFTTGAYITLLAGILGFLLKYLFKKFDDALTKNAESIEIIQTKNQECIKVLENKIIEMINRNEERLRITLQKWKTISTALKEYGNIKRVILQQCSCKGMISSGLPTVWRIALRIKMEKSTDCSL